MVFFVQEPVWDDVSLVEAKTSLQVGAAKWLIEQRANNSAEVTIVLPNVTLSEIASGLVRLRSCWPDRQLIE